MMLIRTFRCARWGDKSDRILHAPSVVGGNAVQLSKELNQLGFPSISVAYESHSFGYTPDITLWKPEMGLFRREIIRCVSVLRVALGYQIIHFNFGTSMAMPSFPLERNQSRPLVFVLRFVHWAYSEFLQIFEVGLLRLLGRRIFVSFQGDDARQGDLSRTLFEISPANHVGDGYYTRLTDRIKRRRIRRLSRIAKNFFYLNPDLQHFLPSTSIFVPYGHIELSTVGPSIRESVAQPFRLLHAPSHRAAKGTPLIESAVRELIAENFNVELVLLEHISHDDVRRELRNGHALIDQLYAGWYGGIGLEAMDLALPVLTYVRTSDLTVVDPKMVDDLPVMSVDAHNLKQKIRDLIMMNRFEYQSLQLRSYQFARRWHNPSRIAASYSKYYFHES